MQCSIITAASSSAIETAVNDWLNDKINTGESISIKYVTMSEGSADAAAIKVLIFYSSDFTHL